MSATGEKMARPPEVSLTIERQYRAEVTSYEWKSIPRVPRPPILTFPNREKGTEKVAMLGVTLRMTMTWSGSEGMSLDDISAELDVSDCVLRLCFCAGRVREVVSLGLLIDDVAIRGWRCMTLKSCVGVCLNARESRKNLCCCWCWNNLDALTFKYWIRDVRRIITTKVINCHPMSRRTLNLNW